MRPQLKSRGDAYTDERPHEDSNVGWFERQRCTKPFQGGYARRLKNFCLETLSFHGEEHIEEVFTKLSKLQEVKIIFSSKRLKPK